MFYKKQTNLFEKPWLFWGRFAVTSRMGCVGWNIPRWCRNGVVNVTSRMGCVGWNIVDGKYRNKATVTSRMGCVGWNISFSSVTSFVFPSHPAWDVWVEIYLSLSFHTSHRVTSRMGCVGWNNVDGTGCSSENCHIPHGMCGLKCGLCLCFYLLLGRHIPHGMCGLK